MPDPRRALAWADTASTSLCAVVRADAVTNSTLSMSAESVSTLVALPWSQRSYARACEAQTTGRSDHYAKGTATKVQGRRNVGSSRRRAAELTMIVARSSGSVSADSLRRGGIVAEDAEDARAVTFDLDGRVHAACCGETAQNTTMRDMHERTGKGT